MEQTGSDPAANNPPSIDAFLNDRFRVFQPTDGGHRAGLDALLLAASVPLDAQGSCADFGSGSGVAGLAALTGVPGLTRLDLIERQPNAAALARQTRAQLLDPSIAARVKVVEGDVRDHEGDYHHIICNPPYNDAGFRPSPNANRATAHAMDELQLKDWVDAARRCLIANGRFAIICRPSGLGDMLDALGRGFGAVRVLPIHSKPGLDANRIILTAIKGRKTPVAILPGFIVHHEDGRFTEVAEAIFAGEARLSV
ncbi:MAG: methyltransferase [Pseudomonadota bacterium]